MKTYIAKNTEVDRKWYLIDAKGQILGKVAVKAATILRGKHKPTYTPHVDTGDYVVVINAKDVVVTGNKADSKVYTSFSGYPSGLKEKSYKELMEKDPAQIVQHAIKGMLPKGPLGRQMFKKLKVYADDKHSQQAQLPEKIEV